jgi:hypothetical protein
MKHILLVYIKFQPELKLLGTIILYTQSMIANYKENIFLINLLLLNDV